MNLADIELRPSFVLTVSPLMFYKLSCLSHDAPQHGDEWLVDECEKLGLPVEHMKLHLTKIVVGRNMTGATWR